jgi:hypothetical protein
MPIYERLERQTNKPFFQYGTTGAKYYYTIGSKKSRDNAYNKALQQTKAIHARKNKISINSI